MPRDRGPGYREEQLHVQPSDWPEGHDVQLEAVLSPIRNRELEQEGENSQQVGVDVVEGELQGDGEGSAKHNISCSVCRNIFMFVKQRWTQTVLLHLWLIQCCCCSCCKEELASCRLLLRSSISSPLSNTPM